MPAMRLDDGAADRKPNAEPDSLGRVERIENAFGVVRRDPGAAVRNTHRDLAVPIALLPRP